MKRRIILLILAAVLSLIVVKGFQVGFSDTLHLMDGKVVSGHDVHHMAENNCQAQDCFLSVIPNILQATLFGNSGVSELMSVFVFLVPIVLFAFVFQNEIFRFRRRRKFSSDFSSVPRVLSTVLLRE